MLCHYAVQLALGWFFFSYIFRQGLFIQFMLALNLQLACLSHSVPGNTGVTPYTGVHPNV